METATPVRARVVNAANANNRQDGFTRRHTCRKIRQPQQGVPMTRFSFLLAACLLAAPAAANAQSTQQVLSKFGMLGTWATDCSEPSGKYNFYAIYAGMSNGNVMRTYYNTPDRKKAYNQYIITRAVILPADMLSYTQEGTVNHDRIDVVLRREGNRYQVWSSVKENGQALVKEGKYPDDGAESPWQTKCNNSTS